MKIKITKTGLTMGGRIYINGQVFKDFKEQRVPEGLRQLVLNGGMIGGKKFVTIIKRKKRK